MNNGATGRPGQAGGEWQPRVGEMDTESILAELQGLANADNAAGMARFGISSQHTLGISMAVLRTMARRIGRNHALAGELWASGIHEARLLATLVDVPAEVTEAQMERWVRDVDSWDVCDQLCGNLLDRTPFAYQKAGEWSNRPEEFVKRAAFSLIAYLAVHDKRQGDDAFLAFLPLIAEQASDERNFVKKAVNWALRQIGKRNRALNAAAIATARDIAGQKARAARWVAADALRELEGEAVQQKLK